MEDAKVAEWLRAVSLTPGADRQAAIAVAAAEFNSEPNATAAAGMVELAFGQPVESAFEQLCELVRNSDPTFAARPDDLETALAAGVLVAEVLSTDTPVAAMAAHSVLSAAWSGSTPSLADLPALASDCLVRRADASRTRGGSRQRRSAQPTIADMADDAGAMTHGEGKVVVEAIKSIYTRDRVQDSEFDALRGWLRASDEELDVLWWAFSGYSDTDTRAWSELAPGRAALLAGIELSTRLNFDTEPVRTDQIFRRLLINHVAGTITLQDAIESLAAPEPAIPVVASNQGLFPVLMSVHECRAMAGKAGWVDSVARWSINTARSVDVISLAEQTVREWLLADNLG